MIIVSRPSCKVFLYHAYARINAIHGLIVFFFIYEDYLVIAPVPTVALASKTSMLMKVFTAVIIIIKVPHVAILWHGGEAVAEKHLFIRHRLMSLLRLEREPGRSRNARWRDGCPRDATCCGALGNVKKWRREGHGIARERAPPSPQKCVTLAEEKERG